MHAILVVSPARGTLQQAVATQLPCLLRYNTGDQLACHGSRNRIAVIIRVRPDGFFQPDLGKLITGVNYNRVKVQLLGPVPAHPDLLLTLAHVNGNRDDFIDLIDTSQQLYAQGAVQTAGKGDRALLYLGNRG